MVILIERYLSMREELKNIIAEAFKEKAEFKEYESIDRFLTDFDKPEGGSIARKPHLVIVTAHEAREKRKMLHKIVKNSLSSANPDYQPTFTTIAIVDGLEAEEPSDSASITIGANALKHFGFAYFAKEKLNGLLK